MRTLLVALALIFPLGCTATRTYQVSVKNDTSEPITIGLVKEGRPIEPQWVSPEQAAIHELEPSSKMWAAIPAGKSADTGPVRGEFDRDAEAVFRIYQGNLKLPDILAISRGQPNRIDILLHPGLNRFTVTDKDGQFRAVRNEGGTNSPLSQ
jgi:hypothetical protein